MISCVVFEGRETRVVYDDIDTTSSCSRSNDVIRGFSQGGQRLPEGGQLVTVDEPISQNSEKS